MRRSFDRRPNPTARLETVVLISLLAALAGWHLPHAAAEPSTVAVTNAADDLPPGTLARIGDQSITVEAFRAEMERRSRGLPGLFDTAEQRRALLDELIAQQTLVAAARAEGLDQLPDVVAAVEKILVARFRQQVLDPRLGQVTIEEAEIRRHYDTNAERYMRPERRRIAMVVFELPRNADERERVVRAHEAELVLAEVRRRADRDFGELARQHSDDAVSRYLGGDVGWVAAGRQSYRWEPQIVAAIFALERVGEVSPVVATPNGFTLIKLVDLDPGAPLPFAQLRASIRHRLMQEERRRVEREFLVELQQQTRVWIDTARVDSIAPPDTGAPRGDPGPPPLPGG